MTGGAPDTRVADVRLRRAVSTDLPLLVALEASFPGDRLRSAELARYVRAADVDVWVAEIDGEIIADAIVVYRRGFGAARLASLVVDPRYRGRGIAARLMRHLEAEAVQRGCVAMRLEVRVDNLAARRLYDALGYELVGTSAGFYEDGSAALRLRKPFGPARVRPS